MSPRRTLTAAVLAVLAGTTLTACRTNVGVAARVNGEPISESQVTDYLTSNGPDDSLRAQAKAAGQELTPARAIVLSYQIQDRLYSDTLGRNGGIPSDGRLTASRDKAVSMLVSSQGGDVTDKQLAGELERAGVRGAFAATYLHFIELKYALITRLKLDSPDALLAAVNKAGAKVTVSPRYGTWDAKNQRLVFDGDAGLPSFLKLQKRPDTSSSLSNETNTDGAGG